MIRKHPRLQKYLARAGLGSRRACETLITAGRVRVDGEPVTRPGTRVLPGSIVEVDGRRVTPLAPRWIALHKPPGYVCSRDDPQGRQTIYDLLPSNMGSLFHVGRLDLMSEGLLLLTNDGDLAHRLLHPSAETPRRYEVVLRKPVAPDIVDRLLRGIDLEDGPAVADFAELSEGPGGADCTLVVGLHEGRNREIRRMMKALGVIVRSLKRISLGPIELVGIDRGAWRDLREDEIAAIEGGLAESGDPDQRKTGE